MIAPDPRRAPSAALPLAYLGTAAAAFVAAALALPWLGPELAGHYYHPRLLALTHTITLGWITLSVMGASYQLVPTVLERPLFSERLARWQLPLFTVGVAGMVAHFALARWPGLAASAALAGAAVGLHIANLALTMRGLPAWTFTARLVALSLAGLGLTALAGLALAANRLAPFLPVGLFPGLHAHVHLALLGFVSPVVMGVAARVLPMFLLAPEPRGWPGRAQLWGLALGVPASVAGILGAPALLALGALGVLAAIAGHLTWVLQAVRGRRRPALDAGLSFVLAGALALPAAAGLGLGLAGGVLAGPRPALAYGVLALGGWASLTIAGMMLKIVPFLVWYRAYAPLAGRCPIPALPDLAWAEAERAAWWLLVPGIPTLALAVAAGSAPAIAAAGAAVAAGAVAFAAALARVLGHLLPSASRRLAAPAAGRWQP